MTQTQDTELRDVGLAQVRVLGLGHDVLGC